MLEVYSEEEIQPLNESQQFHWVPVYSLGGVDETDNASSQHLLSEEIKLDASSLKFLNDNNIDHARAQESGDVQAWKIDSIDIRHCKSDKKEAFIKQHRQDERGLAAMAYELPHPNENFKQGGDFLERRPKNST